MLGRPVTRYFVLLVLATFAFSPLAQAEDAAETGKINLAPLVNQDRDQSEASALLEMKKTPPALVKKKTVAPFSMHCSDNDGKDLPDSDLTHSNCNNVKFDETPRE